MSEISLACNCGKVRGVAQNMSPAAGNRMMCYCGDCRAFLTHLDSSNKFLDQYGGSDNFQMAMANLKITEGIEYVRCLRLTEKGMFRWYTDCCKTPIGNAFSASLPFIATSTAFFEHKESLEKDLGPVRCYLKTESATSPVPPERANSPVLRTLVRAVYKLAIWKIMGLTTPSALFDKDGKPIVEPIILSKQAVA